MRICPLIQHTAYHSVAQSLSLVLDVSRVFLQTQGYSLDETQGSGGVRPERIGSKSKIKDFSGSDGRA